MLQTIFRSDPQGLEQAQKKLQGELVPLKDPYLKNKFETCDNRELAELARIILKDPHLAKSLTAPEVENFIAAHPAEDNLENFRFASWIRKDVHEQKWIAFFHMQGRLVQTLQAVIVSRAKK